MVWQTVLQCGKAMKQDDVFQFWHQFGTESFCCVQTAHGMPPMPRCKRLLWVLVTFKQCCAVQSDVFVWLDSRQAKQFVVFD